MGTHTLRGDKGILEQRLLNDIPVFCLLYLDSRLDFAHQVEGVTEYHQVHTLKEGKVEEHRNHHL